MRGPSPIPRAVALLLTASELMVILEACLGSLGVAAAIGRYLFQATVVVAGAAMMARGAVEPRERGWTVLGVGTVVWGFSQALFDFHYSNGLRVFSDTLSVSWYLAAVAGVVLLVRSRLSGFDLGRWIDGIAIALVAATPLVAVLQTGVDRSHFDALTSLETIVFPALDLLVLGAALGVIGLAAWRPGRAWYLLCVGLSMWVVADTLWSVQATTSKGAFSTGVYQFLWPLGMLLVAYAAWEPRDVRTVQPPAGWRALALPVLCQLVAVAAQVWGLEVTLGDSERIMTIAVLLVVIVQLCVSHAGAERSAAPQAAQERQAAGDA